MWQKTHMTQTEQRCKQLETSVNDYKAQLENLKTTAGDDALLPSRSQTSRIRSSRRIWIIRKRLRILS